MPSAPLLRVSRCLWTIDYGTSQLRWGHYRSNTAIAARLQRYRLDRAASWKVRAAALRAPCRPANLATHTLFQSFPARNRAPPFIGGSPTCVRSTAREKAPCASLGVAAHLLVAELANRSSSSRADAVADSGFSSDSGSRSRLKARSQHLLARRWRLIDLERATPGGKPAIGRQDFQR